MACLHGEGRMDRGTAPFSVDRRGYHVHWEAIPGWVCSQCGEPLFATQHVMEMASGDWTPSGVEC